MWILYKLKWFLQSIYLRKKSKSKNIRKIDSKKQKIILATHADDELIGCSQLIENFNNQVIVIYLGFLGSNLSEENKKKRFTEISNVSKNMKFDLIKIEEMKALDLFLLNYDDYELFIPSYFDWHLEHHYVLEKLFSILNKREQTPKKIDIYMYQESILLPENWITHGISMTRVEARKKWLNIKKNYPSQSNLPWFRFYLNELINGKASKSFSCEAYCFCNKEEWLTNYERLLKYPKYQKFLKENINNLIKVRSKSYEISMLLKK